MNVSNEIFVDVVHTSQTNEAKRNWRCFVAETCDLIMCLIYILSDRLIVSFVPGMTNPFGSFSLFAHHFSILSLWSTRSRQNSYS